MNEQIAQLNLLMDLATAIEPDWTSDDVFAWVQKRLARLKKDMEDGD